MHFTDSAAFHTDDCADTYLDYGITGPNNCYGEYTSCTDDCWDDFAKPKMPRLYLVRVFGLSVKMK